MYKPLLIASFALLLTPPAFGATVTLKTAEKVDAFLHKCLTPAGEHSARIVGQCSAQVGKYTAPSTFVVFYDRDQSHPCTEKIAEVCRQICEPSAPQR